MFFRFSVVEQFIIQMETEEKRVEVKGKLVIVYILPEITRLNGRSGDTPKTIDPFFLLMQKNLPNPSRTVTEIRTGRNKNAAPCQF
jgi:hypothetical protein